MSLKYKHKILSNDSQKFTVKKMGSIISNLDFILLFASIIYIFYVFYQNYSSGPLILFFVLILLIKLVYNLNSVEKESFIVMKDFGVQIDRKYFNGKTKSLFIELPRIKAMIINEGIQNFKVISYVAFFVEGIQKMIIPFENTLPRIDVSLDVYKKITNMNMIKENC